MSSGDESEDEEPTSAKRLKLDKGMSTFLKRATETPLKNEKRKKLTPRFPLPSSDAAHPPKLDKAISIILLNSACTYGRFLSKLQQFNMDSLGPLITVLSHVKKGKCTAKDLISPLEAAINLTGNAAAHMSVERRKSLMRHLNGDLKPLAEGDFPDRGLLLFVESFASKAKSTADNVKALKGFIQKKPLKGFSESGSQNKRKSYFPPQGRRTSWGTQKHFQRLSVLNRLALPLRQAQPIQKPGQQTKK